MMEISCRGHRLLIDVERRHIKIDSIGPWYIVNSTFVLDYKGPGTMRVFTPAPDCRKRPLVEACFTPVTYNYHVQHVYCYNTVQVEI